MAWDFSTEPEFQEKLDWIDGFVRDEIEELDLAFSSHVVYDRSHPVHEKVIRPLQQQVRERGLWACHLGPDLGGLGYGQLKLALMNEVLGRSNFAPLARPSNRHRAPLTTIKGQCSTACPCPGAWEATL